MKKMIITDNLDLSSKKAMSYKDFYGEEKTKGSDSTRGYVARKKSETEFFAIVSTTDKVINNRIYSGESWKDTVENGKWTKPYQRPILANHDLYNCEPKGRILSTFLVDHQNMSVTLEDSAIKMPEDVLKHFKDSGAFGEGSYSIIAKFNADEETAAKIKDGIYMTVSQSSFMQKASCTVCGADYFKEGCSHWAGETYEIEKDGVKENVTCYVKTEDYDPIELSFVNLPANDTSLVCAYDAKEKKVKKCDGKETEEKEVVKTTDSLPAEKESKIDDEKELCKNGKAEDAKPTHGGVDVFKQLAKDHLTNLLDGKLEFVDGVNASFDKLFESITDEQVALLKDFIVNLKTVEDSEEAEEVIVPEEEKTEAETKKDTTEENPEAEAEGNKADNTEEDEAGSDTEGSTEAESNEAEGKPTTTADNLKSVFGEKKEIKNDYADPTLMAMLNMFN